MAVTRRQLRLVCEATGIDAAVLDALDAAPGPVLQRSSHRRDEQPESLSADPRSPRSSTRSGRSSPQRRIGFAYGSLASGADILVAEAVLDAGIRLEIVLPFDTDEFEAVSVAPAGAGWAERFRSCLARGPRRSCTRPTRRSCTTTRCSATQPRIAMGHALNHAAFLDAPVEQLAMWDGDSSSGVAGTAHDVAIWSAAGHPTHVISLPASTRRPRDASTDTFRAESRDRHDRLHRSARVQPSPRRAILDVRR